MDNFLYIIQSIRKEVTNLLQMVKINTFNNLCNSTLSYT